VARFVKTAQVVRPEAVNVAGGRAYQESYRLELVSHMLTSMVEDKFYRSAEDGLLRLRVLVRAVDDKQFVAKAAVLAREWGMRSVTHAAIAELCAVAKGESWLKPAIAKVIQRPDDASEILGYWLSTYGKPIPNSMKRGIALGLTKFNDYSLAKYKGETHELKMVDVVNLTHAKSAVIDQLMRGTLETPDTWETAITAAGSDLLAKKAAWTRLVLEGKLPYFALLRNLRNIETYASADALRAALIQLTDTVAIHKSKVLPFRFTTAIEQVQNPRIKEAIARAADIALDNLPALEGTTLVALDCSGSMSGKPRQIGSLFAAALAKRTYADVMLFGSQVDFPKFNPADSLTTLAAKFNVGQGGTNFHLIFDHAQKAYDRIIILTDMQAWMARSEWYIPSTERRTLFGGYGTPSTPQEAMKDYKARTGAKDTAIWTFDLAGLGTLQFPEKSVYALAGFSERVFDLVPVLEAGGKDALVKLVERVSLY
jgi:60 kDa SS-A/Ro ribonucleoprotein